MPLSSYVWDLSNPNVPEAELLGPSQLVCAKFNVKDANLVGAGQYNGQVGCVVCYQSSMCVLVILQAFGCAQSGRAMVTCSAGCIAQ